MKIDSILKTIILLFIVLALFNNPQTKELVNNLGSDVKSKLNPPPSQNNHVEGNFLERSLSKVALNVLKTPEGRAFLENIITPVGVNQRDDFTFKSNNPEIMKSILKMKTHVQGEGEEAFCGCKIRFSYQTKNLRNIVIEPFKTHELILGSRQVIPALEASLTGMKQGELRSAIAMPKYAYNNKKFFNENYNPAEPIKLEVRLLEISSKVKIKPEEVKIFDDHLAYKAPIICGDMIRTHLKITKFNGKTLFDSKAKNIKLHFRVGDPSYPIIFGYGLQHKIATGTRVIITPGKYLASLEKEIGLFKNIDKGEEFYILEFYEIDAPKYY